MPDNTYSRLTWARQRAVVSVGSESRSSLWLGADHLLVVETNGYTEKYKRFYFRDIQALDFRKTQRWHIWTLVLSLICGGLALIGVLTGSTVGMGVFGGLAALVAIPLVVNILRGSTCSCRIRTAVQTEPLWPLSRFRRAQKVLAILRPRIAEAQGNLTPGEIMTRMRPAPTATTPTVETAAEPLPSSPTAPGPTPEPAGETPPGPAA